MAQDAPSGAQGHLDGVELHDHSPRQAEALAADAGYRARVVVGDFFDHAPTGSYEAVIGNPPYVRRPRPQPEGSAACERL